jgi:hypothetical protein
MAYRFHRERSAIPSDTPCRVLFGFAMHDDLFLLRRCHWDVLTSLPPRKMTRW